MSSTPTAPPALLWLIDIVDARLADAVRALPGSVGGEVIQDLAGLSSTEPTIVMVWTDQATTVARRDDLLATGACLILAGPTLHHDVDGVWRETTGLLCGASTPVHDIRVRAGRDAGALADRLGDHTHSTGAHLGEHVHVDDRVLLIDKVSDDVDVLLTAAVGLAPHPVLARRGNHLAWTIGTTAASVATPAMRRLLGLTIHSLLDRQVDHETVRAGLLGYGAIGNEHSAALREVAGLSLGMVCDRNEARLEAAQVLAADVRTTTDPHAIIDDPDIDLVVVSTPPDTHATWALRALRAGKHVVVEKPFAIRTDEADAVLAEAEAAGLLAVVYQNRRWDPDHLAIRAAVRAGHLGEVFHLETFVGGYGHPCNLWHSDADTSGGAFYDWGAHVLDQILDLVPTPVEHVSATTHKRRWMDVTNADHSRLLLHFSDGTEAEFVHSDLAAALKPRWYVLGTAGAIVGSWRTERVIGRNDVGTLAEDVLAPADSPPILDLYGSDASVTRMTTPTVPPHPFHRELADHLLLGLPMSVTGLTSRRVLSVMEAATASALDGGRPVTPR